MLLTLALTLTPCLGSAQEPDPWTALFHEQLRAHYRQVERELLAADVSEFDPVRRTARERAIEALREYRERGNFGSAFREVRVPRFRDTAGRRCAVAELIHVWGEDDLLNRLATDHNEAYLAELSGDGELRAALHAMGLSFREASRIHAPVPGPSPGQTNNAGVLRSGAPDTVPPTPRLPVTAGAAGPTRSRSGRSSGVLTGPRTGGSAPTPIPRDFTMTTFPYPRDLQSHWWTWWEFNKSRWLVGDEPAAWKTEGLADQTRAETRFERLRRELAPLVLEHLGHADAGVRAAAAVALPRLWGEQAVEPLLAALEDPQHRVRNAALLGLGATGSPRAAHSLLQIAHRGALEGLSSISQWARPLAVVALAAARERGVRGFSAAMLPRELSVGGQDVGTENERLTDAVFLHPLMAPAPELRDLALVASGLFDEDSDGEPETRAIEALRFGSDPRIFSHVLRAIGHRDLQVRRSAVLTIGELGNDLALEPLMTAFELENEHLTRGFLLLSIGRIGGESAREFLSLSLREGSSTVRPWSALALGMLAEEEDDDVAREQLRAAFTKERNRDARGAYLLAMGIAGDSMAVPILSDVMMESGNALDRSLSSLALAISAPERAVKELRESIEAERAPLTKAAMAQALASLALPQDAPLLVGLLREASDPTMQVQLAAAVGIHGTYEITMEVVKLLGDRKLSNHGRAAAIQCLGMLLDRRPPFRLAATSRGTNFTVLPAWIDVPLQSTL